MHLVQNLTYHQFEQLAQVVVASTVGMTYQGAVELLLYLFDDIPGLELVSHEQKMAWVDEIWKLAVELRAGGEGRSCYPNSNGDRSDDQDL